MSGGQSTASGRQQCGSPLWAEEAPAHPYPGFIQPFTGLPTARCSTPSLAAGLYGALAARNYCVQRYNPGPLQGLVEGPVSPNAVSFHAKVQSRTDAKIYRGSGQLLLKQKQRRWKRLIADGTGVWLWSEVFAEVDACASHLRQVRSHGRLVMLVAVDEKAQAVVVSCSCGGRTVPSSGCSKGC